jgi:hypothetical protein
MVAIEKPGRAKRVTAKSYRSAPVMHAKRRAAEVKEEHIATLKQRHQRELAWLLYITEGYASNLAHARTVNAYTLNRGTLRMLAEVQQDIAAAAMNIRLHMEAV